MLHLCIVRVILLYLLNTIKAVFLLLHDFDDTSIFVFIWALDFNLSLIATFAIDYRIWGRAKVWTVQWLKTFLTAC